MASKLHGLIARAIKDADKSFFNEDYGKQAEAVIAALNRAGYELVPRRPSEAFTQYMDENMPLGRLRPRELVHALYKMIVENARRLDE